MNQQIKTRWLEALQSGQYEQGQDYLNRFNKFCCLGVLCDLYLKEKGLDWGTVSDSKEPLECCDFVTYPPDQVFEWADDQFLKDNSVIPGLLNRTGAPVLLTELNDDDKLDFGKLSDIINYFY